MRCIVLLSLTLLVSCATKGDNPLSTQAPGLDVADVALANGAPETALHIAQRALASRPRDVEALLRKGAAETALGQRENAARSFRQALAVAPGNSSAELGLGRLELATDPTAAADVLLQLSARDPGNVAALVDLGVAKDLTGQHAEAQRAYRRALAIDPANTGGQVNLGLSLALSGDPQQALSILRPLAGAAAPPRVRQDLAVALALAGDDEEAASVLQNYIPKPEVVAAVTGYHSLRSAP